MKDKIYLPPEQRLVVEDHLGHSVWVGTVTPSVHSDRAKHDPSPELSLAEDADAKDPYNLVGARL